MSASKPVAAVNRRELLRAGASLPLALTMGASEAGEVVTRTPPAYTISINIEIMFPPRDVAHDWLVKNGVPMKA